MSTEQKELEGFELTYSVQIDSSQLLELLVDEMDTGDSVWQTTNASGQVLNVPSVTQIRLGACVTV